MTTLYREFTIDSPFAYSIMAKFMKSNAPACIERKAPLRVIVTDEQLDRLDVQISYYFGVVIRALVEQAWVNGRQFDKVAWHEEMAKRFLPGKEVELPSGEIVFRRQSIARGHIGVKAMAKYTLEVEVYAATEHGIEFDSQRMLEAA